MAKKNEIKPSKKKEETVELKEEGEKISIWNKFMNFCHGVKVESKRVHWTTKNDLLKYSIATLIFVVFFSLFFYCIDAVYALVHSL